MECNKKVLMLGMGKTGKAVCAFLQKRGASVATFDDAFPREAQDTLLSQKYDYAVVSPGIPKEHAALCRLKTNGVPILSELDLAYINCPSKRIFAISGTNGKTTACTILHSLLSTVGRSHLVGNVGAPWIGEVERIRKRDFVVVEVSSFQIEQSQFFKPYVAALTNVGEDHLDRHLTRDRYQRIKLSLLEKADIKVINRSDPAQKGVSGAISYSVLDPAADFYLTEGVIYHKDKKYKLEGGARGAAYDLNYLCAFAMASVVLGVKKSFLSLYETIPVPPFRCQYVSKLCGASVYNDSKGTNVDATLFAVRQFSGSVTLILGGSDKGEDYARLFSGLGANVRSILLTGANAWEMYLSAGDAVREKCRVLPDLDRCVRAFTEATSDVLLFSPASASFDRYANYEERGKRFNEIVAKYAATAQN